MIDHTELKRLAEAANLPMSEIGLMEHKRAAMKAMHGALLPDDVLDLIAELDRLRTQNQALREALKRAKPFVEGREYECEALYDTSKDGAHYDAFATARDIREQCDSALAQAEGGV